MASTEPSPSPTSEDLGPDPVPENTAGSFERYEWMFVGLFVFLIALGSFQRWNEESSEFQPLSIERGEDSEKAGSIDWSRPIEPRPLESKDLNQATRSDLLALPGVGPALADSILEARKQKGGFRSYAELDEVPGIGPSRLDTLRPFLQVPGDSPMPIQAVTDSPLTPNPAVEDSAPQDGDGDDSIPSETPDLNSMTLDDLMEIPGIGETFATRILQKKTELGSFQSWDQVGSISGIGPKRLENLRNHARLR